MFRTAGHLTLTFLIVTLKFQSLSALHSPLLTESGSHVHLIYITLGIILYSEVSVLIFITHKQSYINRIAIVERTKSITGLFKKNNYRTV